MRTHAEAKAPKSSGTNATPVPNALAHKAQLRSALLQAGVQPRLEIGAADDALEREAECVAHQLTAPAAMGSAPVRIQCLAGDNNAGLLKFAPPNAEHTLAGGGQPLESTVRQSMEQRFGYDFSRVRVHTDSDANASARAMSAQAYTAGSQVVFAAGKYSPNTLSGQRLLAHELVHVVQQAGAPQQVQRQPTQAGAGQADVERPDYVFVMGRDRNGFYATAEGYFRAHHPRAHFVTDKRSLGGVLEYIANNVSKPIGNLYLVVHANEDGTLDLDGKPGVISLRNALRPTQLGQNLNLAMLSRRLKNSSHRQIDARTMIRIKGCNLGQTKEMLDLLDEAFGGAGTVIAPTREQAFEINPHLGAQADAEFRAEVTARHPEPAAVDETLSGEEARAARAAHARATQERSRAIAAEMRQRDAERRLRVAQAQYQEALSGPMFQHPGEQLYTRENLLPELERLYGHLSDERREEMADRLVALDPRDESTAQRMGIVGQKGQRVYPHRFAHTFEYPRDGSDFLVLFGQELRTNPSLHGFEKSADPPSFTTEATQDGWRREYCLHGTQNNLQKSFTRTYTLPNDDTYLSQAQSLAKARLNNPDRYGWGPVLSTYDKGITTLAVVASRVIAYLHHDSLNAGPNDYFNPPESDANFYTRSTFDFPPQPPP